MRRNKPSSEAYVEELLEQQRRAWENGERTPVKDYLSQHPDLDPEQAADLVYHEFILRVEAGDDVSLQQYVDKFPQFSESLRRLQYADGLLTTIDSLGRRSGPDLDDFELLEEIGVGGMGVVYRARQESLERIVAIKLMRAGRTTSDVDVARFENEARLAANLQHPNIVGVFQVGNAAGEPYLVMEYVAGTDLSQAISADPIPYRTAAGLMATVSRAIEFAHSQGIVHRDLKPSNILLQQPEPSESEGNGRFPSTVIDRCVPKVSDFGLARRISLDARLTVTGAVLGTPSYLAPEQVSGDPSKPGPACDVYSLGAVLYELLTGRPPFRANSVPETLRQVTEHDPPSPRLINPAVPKPLETICLKCLRKEPGHRYSTAKDLADDLDRFLTGHPIHARPAGWVPVTRYWCRRHPAMAAVSLLLMVAIPILVTSYLRYEKRLADMRVETAVRQQELKTKESLAISHQYHSLVRGVGEELLSDNPIGVDELLSEVATAARLETVARNPVELRSLAARCLTGISLRPAAELAFGKNIFCSAYSCDGSLLAAGEYQGLGTCSIFLFDVKTRQLVQTLSFPTDAVDTRKTGVRSLAFSPNGQFLAGGTRNGEVHIWNFNSNCERISFSASSVTVSQITWSGDGTHLCTISDDFCVRAWSIDTRELVASSPIKPHSTSITNNVAKPGLLDPKSSSYLPALATASLESEAMTLQESGHVWNLTFSRDGRLLASTNPANNIIISNPRMVFENRLLSEEFRSSCHSEEIKALQFELRNQWILSSALDRTLKVWDFASGKRLASLSISGLGNVHATVHPDGSEIAMSTEGRVALYDVVCCEAHFTLGHSARPIQAFEFSPDGQFLATNSSMPYSLASGEDKSVSELVLWDLLSRKHHASQVYADVTPLLAWPSLAFHPDGNSVLWANGLTPGICGWDIERRRSLPVLQQEMPSLIRFSRDGNSVWFTKTDEELFRFHRPDGTARVTWSNIVGRERSGVSSIVDLHVGKTWTVAGGRDGYTKLLLAKTGQFEKEWPSQEGPVHSVALNRGENLAASGTQTGVLQIAQVPTGLVLDSIDAHRDRINSVAISPDESLIATASRDRSVNLWRWHRNKLELWTQLPAYGPVSQVRFHPSGRLLGMLVQNETAVRIWDLEKLREEFERLGI